MTVMTAPPSTKAEIVDVPFAHRELVQRLSPGGRYIDAQTDVDSPWVPFGAWRDRSSERGVPGECRRHVLFRLSRKVVRKLFLHWSLRWTLTAPRSCCPWATARRSIESVGTRRPCACNEPVAGQCGAAHRTARIRSR